MKTLTNGTKASIITYNEYNGYVVSNLINYKGKGTGQMPNYKGFNTYKTLKAAEKFAAQHLNS